MERGLNIINLLQPFQCDVLEVAMAINMNDYS